MRIYKRRVFYRIARIAAMFLIGLVVAAIIALSQVNLETLREDLLHTMRDATGLPIEIDGEISWKFSLRPKVELNNIRIPNADWAKNKNAVTAKKVDVTLNLMSLLRDRPTIQSVKIYDVDISVEENTSGEYSIKQLTDEERHMDASDRDKRYPFGDLGMGVIEIRDLIAHVNGSTYAFSGFQISYKSGKNSREYSGWLKSDGSVYPFIISLSEYNEERKVYPVRVALSTGGEALVANIALEGTSLMPIDFILKGNIPDIAPLGRAVDIDIPELPRIKVNMSGGFGHKKITLRKSSVTIGGTDMTISGDLDWGAEVPKMNLKIKANKIDIVELFPDLYASGTEWIRPNRPLNVFKDTPLYGTELLNKNISLDLDVGTLRVYRDMEIKNLKLTAKLKEARTKGYESHLSASASARFAEGDVRAGLDVEVDANGKLNVRGAGIGERIYIGEFMKELREYDYISELPVNFEFYLMGTGGNLSELMSTVTGPLYIYSVAPGYAHSELVSFVYGTDFLTDLRHNIQDLFRSEKKHNQITISCAAIKLKLRNGKVETTNGVAIETNAINIRLAGMVDLANETLKASLITVPSRGLKITLTGGLVNSMEFTGNLAEPDVKISGSAVVSKVASATGIGLLLAPFTGGLSIVAGAGIGLVAGDFLENWLSDPHPCRTALDHGAAPREGDPEWLSQPMSQLVGELIK